MNTSVFLKSVIDADTAPVVICNLEHEIVYMNPSAEKRYEKWGGKSLLGRSLLNCHNKASAEKINAVISWFSKSRDNNRVYTFRNDTEQKDVYMIALRDESGELIGYYEKHEYRLSEASPLYEMKG